MTPEGLLRESLAMRWRLYPEGHKSIAVDLYNLARLLKDRGELAPAEPLFRHSIELHERSSGDSSAWAASSRLGLGVTLTRLGRFRDAEKELLAAEVALAAAANAPAGRHQESVEALAKLYQAWEKAEPGRGHDAQAAKWSAPAGG